MTNIPDSVDIVSLMYPEALADFEKSDIETMHNKGSKVVYTSATMILKLHGKTSRLIPMEKVQNLTPIFKQNLINNLAYFSFISTALS